MKDNDRDRDRDRDKAIFEAGIKLGALYHQFLGTPVSTETAEGLETAIKRSVSLQPWVSAVEVKIDREKVLRAQEKGRGTESPKKFKYCELSGEMLDVKVVVLRGQVEVQARVKYEEELAYPLMRLEKVAFKSPPKNLKNSSTKSNASGRSTKTA